MHGVTLSHEERWMKTRDAMRQWREANMYPWYFLWEYYFVGVEATEEVFCQYFKKGP